MFSPSETALTRLMAAIFNEKFNFFPEISTIDATMSDFSLKMKVALQSLVEKVCKYGTTEIPTTVKPEPTSDASDTTSTISTGSTENHQGGSTQSSTATATTTSNGRL